ncbi:head-tail connector protein [Tistrella bauzanensis]|uniref:head-tail connector protein n=1 Tax=Tistrella TaxID=171436 RepID=UPI0031F68D57
MPPPRPRLRLITAPDPVITLDEARAHLRVDHEDEDDLIAAQIAAATAMVDGQDGWLGRCIGVQTWRATWDGSAWPEGRSGAVPIPLPPLVSIGAVSIVDPAGDTQALVADTDYRVADGGSYLSAIVPPRGQCWPDRLDDIGSLAITYTAGYATGTLPAPIRAAILLTLGKLYEHREDVVSGTIMTRLPSGADALLLPYRIWA